jgi:PHP family Zn ribbon phosphoesterase
MPSDRQSKVVPVVRVARMFQWECPSCGRWNHEAEFTLYDASALGKYAQSKCVKCEAAVELSL